MQRFWQSVVLAVIYQVGAVASVEDFQLIVLEEYLQVFLYLLLTLLLYQLDGLFKRNGHRIFIFG